MWTVLDNGVPSSLAIRSEVLVGCVPWKLRFRFVVLCLSDVGVAYRRKYARAVAELSHETKAMEVKHRG